MSKLTGANVSEGQVIHNPEHTQKPKQTPGSLGESLVSDAPEAESDAAPHLTAE